MKKVTNLINITSLINELAKAKQLDKKTVTKIVEKAFTNLINRKFKGVIKAEALYIAENDNFRFLQIKKVVDKNTNSPFEISLKEALLLNDQSMVGDEIGSDIPDSSPELSFSRNDILILRQTINNILMDESKVELTKEYSNKIGKLVSGTVKQVHDHALIVDLGKTEAKLPIENLIPSYSRNNEKNYNVEKEKFRVNDRITAVLESVVSSRTGAELILSRTSNEFALRMLEKEVQEVEDGSIIVEKIARVPGRKTKFVISSNIYNEKQLMHTLIGSNGFRVQNLSNQLNTENINFIVQGTFRETLEQLIKPVESINRINNEDSVIVVIDEQDIGKFLGTKNHNALLNGSILEKTLFMITHQNIKKLNEKLSLFLETKGLSTIESTHLISASAVFRSAAGIAKKMKIEDISAENYYVLMNEFLQSNTIEYDAIINSKIPLWKRKTTTNESSMTAQKVREELKLR